MNYEESLKKIEPKEQDAAANQNAAGGVEIDRTRIAGQISVRLQKLENIKAFIPLKTYNTLREQLAAEQQQIAGQLARKEKKIREENREQLLPKIFFEQRFLKPKAIRIE